MFFGLFLTEKPLLRDKSLIALGAILLLNFLFLIIYGNNKFTFWYSILWPTWILILYGYFELGNIFKIKKIEANSIKETSIYLIGFILIGFLIIEIHYRYKLHNTIWDYILGIPLLAIARQGS